MTYTVENFVRRFMDLTQDPTNVRWPTPEVVRYMNDGQRAIAMHRPDAFTTNAVLDTVAGVKQSLPAGSTKLIAITGNGETGRVVTPIKPEILASTTPAWRTTTPAAVILHYMYDERDPLVYEVYPPSNGSATLQSVRAVVPTDIPTPTTNFLEGVSGNLSVADIHANILMDWTIFMAYSKDAEWAANGERAMGALGRFGSALGLDMKTLLAYSPNQNSPLNPNMPRSATRPVGQ